MSERVAQIAKAREADERIAAAWDAYWPIADKIDAAREGIRRNEERKARYVAKGWARDIEFCEKEIVAHQAKIDALRPQAQEARAAAIALDEALYEGWQRFFLVKHIHGSRSCSSFRPTTRIGWLPNVSGLTEAEAVAEYGPNLCTICFPSAPVEWTQGSQDHCPGSGKHYTRDLPHRLGFYGGNWVTCPECGKQVGISRNGFNIPKHKPQAA